VKQGTINRVAVLGRGGAGKSTLARRLALGLDLPLVELDQLFWQNGSEPPPSSQWLATETALISEARWVIDGDLGPYEVNRRARLAAADTVIILDFPLWLCAWRSLRRGRENAVYWRWVISYRRKSLPPILDDATSLQTPVSIHRLRNQHQADRLVDSLISVHGSR